MVIDDFNIDRTRRVLRPLETNPPLAIDPDTALAFTVARKGFEMVAG
jgi:hypothetical protein